MSDTPGDRSPRGGPAAEPVPATPGDPESPTSDEPESATPGDAVPLSPERHPAALAAAITTAWRPYRWRAYLVGSVVGILFGGILTALATTSVSVALAFAGVTIDPALPWAEIAWSVAFVVAFAASGAWAVARWLPHDFRAATETYVWMATRAETHWRERLGEVPVPRTPAGMRSFLAATPGTTDNAGERFGLWIALGELEAARQEIAQMPETTAGERYSRAGATWLVDFVGGATGPLEPLHAAAEAIDDPVERLDAEVDVAVHAARVAVVDGGDWMAPMASVRGRLGAEPSRIMWRFAWGSAFRSMLSAAVIGVAAYWVLLLVL